MSEVEVSHREIYDRLLAVELKVDKVEKNTEDVVKAFDAAAGAFVVLETLGKIAKPILWVTALAGGILALWQNNHAK